jgi:glycerophosphoryl diester phosphodiesterase
MAAFLIPPASPFQILPTVFTTHRSSTTTTATTTTTGTASSNGGTSNSVAGSSYSSLSSHCDDDDSSNSITTTTSSSSSSSSSSSDYSTPTATASIPPQNSLRHVLGVQDGVNTSSPITTTTFPRIVGHRGCLYQQLENTREGFQACAHMGCDAVELDVFYLPKCGTLVVFHGGGNDDTPGLLQDYCGVPGSILEYTYQEAINTLRFNPSFAEFGCPPEITTKGTIPTLEQILLDAKESGLHVKIELKGDGTVRPTIDLVETLGMVPQVSYSSFDFQKLAELRALRTNATLYPTGALFTTRDLPHDYIQRAKECGATEIHLQYDSCTRQRVREIHQAGLGSMCWMRGPIGMKQDCSTKYWDVDNEDLDMYQALIDTGVQQMCINRPDVLIQWRERHQEMCVNANN